jgi:hypothetical protein
MPYQHSKSVYEAMLKSAKSAIGDEGTKMLVWKGFTTRLFDEVGLSTPYYTSILGHLKRMGCIKQLQRGGSSTPSQWHLITAPTEELWHDSVARGKPSTKIAMLEQRVDALNQRLLRIERMLEQAS